VDAQVLANKKIEKLEHRVEVKEEDYKRLMERFTNFKV
jgi:hypothetical protein